MCGSSGKANVPSVQALTNYLQETPIASCFIVWHYAPQTLPPISHNVQAGAEPEPREGFGRTTCPLLTQKYLRPTRAAPRAARSGTRRVTRIRGAGREEGSKVAGGWGFLPQILAPPIPLERYRPTVVVARNSTRGQGRGGATPQVKAPSPRS